MTVLLQSAYEAFSATNLICPVRNCRLPLRRGKSSLLCANSHSFDRARSGYFNLLQPQERRSNDPGDTAATVRARKRLHDLGVTRPLLAGIAGMLEPEPSDSILDAGCGDGFYLGNLAKQFDFAGHGIDISIPAVDSAAKGFRQCEWIVGNADRSLPYASESFSAVTSITARMNTAEFRRVLRPKGRLLVAVPASDDLIELRGRGRDRAQRTIEAFAAQFRLEHRGAATTSVELDADAVNDVLHSIYRPLRAARPGAMRVTFSLDLLLFRARETEC